jgi:hypothetical protein
MFSKRTYQIFSMAVAVLLSGCIDCYDNPRYHWTSSLKPDEVIARMRELPLEERYEMYLYVWPHTRWTRSAMKSPERPAGHARSQLLMCYNLPHEFQTDETLA